MTVAENKETVKRHYEEIFNKGDLSSWDELMDKDYFMTGIASGLKGLAYAKQLLAGRKASSPDMRITIDEMVGQGNLVAVRGQFKGTYTGEIEGKRIRGKKFTRNYMAFYRFKNGKIAQGWTTQDVLGFYRQLGVIPPAPQPAAPARTRR